MSPDPASHPVAATQHPTVWGLTPTELHDRFWAARGVQVVRAGEDAALVSDAELFLLLAPRLLTVFRLRLVVDHLSWVEPRVLWLRLRDNRERGYRETALTDAGGDFVGFQREYGGGDARLARVALTPERALASLWQSHATAASGWRELRRRVPRERRSALPVAGWAYDRNSDAEVMRFVRDLVRTWPRPDATIPRIRHLHRDAWGDEETGALNGVRFVGPVWVGAGRRLDEAASVVGPAVLWDDPAARRAAPGVDWQQLEPTEVLRSHPIHPRPPSSLRDTAKRIFDLAAALAALAVVVPLFPLVMAAIYIEDGRPIFFAHRRESRGGRTFACLKFRSMYRNAEQIKSRLVVQNQADGPQFFMDDDPRITRVGRFLRRYHIDELPQLFNVLVGDMAIVGPRPSPHRENQYCPPWREARLSVRPGITGLWQVMRTRRKGLDFQEWIRYDIEYVNRRNFALDLWIMWKTLLQILRRK